MSCPLEEVCVCVCVCVSVYFPSSPEGMCVYVCGVYVCVCVFVCVCVYVRVDVCVPERASMRPHSRLRDR